MVATNIEVQALSTGTRITWTYGDLDCEFETTHNMLESECERWVETLSAEDHEDMQTYESIERSGL